MNVRISHSTELSDVPSKVVDLLKKPDDKLMQNTRKIDLISEILQESNGKYTTTALEMLDDLRKELAIIDQDLLECQSILEGYVQVHSPQSPTPAPTEDPNVLPSPEESFREMLASGREATGELPQLENNNV